MSAPPGLKGLVLQAEVLASASSTGHIATTEQCLQRLVLGGIAVIVLVEASTAEAAVQQQNLLNHRHLPEGVSIVTTQPRLLAICLRAATTKMSLDASVVAFVTLETRQAAAACKLAGLQLIATPQRVNSNQQLLHLLRHVADSHRRVAALLVGYTMKPSRERNLASRGLLPLTAPHGVCFVPVDFGQPLEQQGPFDVMLHKATDELISRGPKQLPEFSARIASLAAYTKAHPETVLVDSLDTVHQVIDRQTLTVCLEEAATAARAQGFAVQTPTSIQVDRLGPDAETRHLLAQSGIRLPCIVKPRVACGTPEAHQMAVVLQEDGFKDLQVFAHFMPAVLMFDVIDCSLC
ncbi:TPA: Inositol-tetrakisphosphate 1-kinase, variant 2 [Trebouxia sp. C0004]